jgi:hypothetical protein
MRFAINNKLFKLLAVVSFICAVICIGVGASLQYDYGRNMPKISQPELNMTYSLNVHGTVVYLTEEQHLLLKWLFHIGEVSIIIFMISAILANKKENNEPNT